MSRHTLGPWEYNEESERITAAEYDIAELWPGPPEYAANGRLIAAAPELLQFAEQLLIYTHEDDERIWLAFDGHSVGFRPNSDAARVLLHIEAARRAAIAKAEGKPE